MFTVRHHTKQQVEGRTTSQTYIYDRNMVHNGPISTKLSYTSQTVELQDEEQEVYQETLQNTAATQSNKAPNNKSHMETVLKNEFELAAEINHLAYRLTKLNRKFNDPKFTNFGLHLQHE